MQSWGTRSKFDDRDTDLEPSKSGVIGLVCAALGVTRDDTERTLELAALRLGVRVDHPGILRTDYHTAQMRPGDPKTNTVVLGDEEDLKGSEMNVAKINWIKYDGLTDGMEAITKIRYKDKGALSNLYTYENGVKVRFYDNVKGIAPGQSAVFYEGDDVIGGGIIQRPNP